MATGGTPEMPQLTVADFSSEQIAKSSIWQSRIALTVVIGGALIASSRWFENPQMPSFCRKSALSIIAKID